MPRTKKIVENKERTLYILDTNVLLHDPFSLFKFKDNDIYIPFVTIEELDNKKSGTSDVNRNARQATRLLDAIVSTKKGGSIKEGFELKDHAKEATGKLFLQTDLLEFLSNEHDKKNDNMYIAVMDHLKKTGRRPVMVTKDLNLRIKAKALDFDAEDYKHDHAVEDSDFIYKGWRFVSEEELSSWMLAANSVSVKDDGATYYMVKKEDLRINEYLVVSSEVKPRTFRVVRKEGDLFQITTVKNYLNNKHALLGVTARNEEQCAAMDLLMNPDIDLVCLLGPAGTGKTLLALASSLKQVASNQYDGIIFTRANIPLGEDIGFLPGNEEEKMAPWLGALYDNIDFLCEKEDNPAEAQKLRSLTDEAIDIRAVSFMRGRTFQRKILILDEAQNLTPKQMKALVTRCGEGTKLIALGNLAQIDSPYLSETSSGLAYLVERFKGWEGCGSLVLEKGVRSRLANEGNARL